MFLIAEGGEEGWFREVKVVAVAAVRDVVADVGRVAWVVPRQPGQAATACVPIAATRRLTRWGSHVMR